MTEKTWEKQIEDLCIACGLSDKEALIYRILLENGELPAKGIVSLSKIKKGNAYALLHSLEAEGLVSPFKREKKTWFRPEAPGKLQELVRKKTAEVKRTQGVLGDLLPKLSSLYKLSIGRPVVRYFEGEEGIREVFDDIYGPKKEPVYGCVDLEATGRHFSSYILEKLIPKRVKNKVFSKALVGDSPQTREVRSLDKEELRETALLDKKKYPLSAEIDVYGDKIALLSFEKGEFIGLLIENKSLAKTLKSIFKVAHDLSRKYQRT